MFSPPKLSEGPPKRILDFDIETMAAGFADPNWVPQKITCIAWSWVSIPQLPSNYGYSVMSTISTPMGFFIPEIRKAMLESFLPHLLEADVVTGHNIVRFDLPILNAECIRLGLDPLPPMLAEDTMRLPKTKGLKKGQDNLGGMFKLTQKKRHLDWQGWEDAYAEPSWSEVRARCESDVLMHKELREAMNARGLLKPARLWTP